MLTTYNGDERRLVYAAIGNLEISGVSTKCVVRSACSFASLHRSTCVSHGQVSIPSIRWAVGHVPKHAKAVGAQGTRSHIPLQLSMILWLTIVTQLYFWHVDAAGQKDAEKVHANPPQARIVFRAVVVPRNSDHFRGASTNNDYG